VIDDRINQTARRVAVHQAVDEIVKARRHVGDNEPGEALSDALDHLSVVALDDPPTAERAWQVVAAIAQSQLEQAMEDRAR
jgi:DNA-directed RNA polymerase specialized sigma24 family protein